MNQGDADSRTDLLKVRGGKDRAVVAIKDFGESIGEDGVFEHALQRLRVLLKRPGGAHDKTGMIIDDAAEKEFASDAVDFKAQAMHKIREPEFIDMRFLELFPGLRRLGFGFQVMVQNKFSDGVFAGRPGLNGAFIDQHAVQTGDFQRGKLIEFPDDDGLELIVNDSGLSLIGTGFGFEAVKTGDAIVTQPGFKGFPVVGFMFARRNLIDFVRHLLEIAGLALGAFMQNRGNDAIAEQGDFIGAILRTHSGLSYKNQILVNYD